MALKAKGVIEAFQYRARDWSNVGRRFSPYDSLIFARYAPTFELLLLRQSVGYFDE
jgi:hypothetical protein